MKEEISKACMAMQDGGIVLYPSDTVWGIGCDATNDWAVGRIYGMKQRNRVNPMLVIVGSLQQLCEYVEMPSKAVLQFINAFPTPLTIVYPRVRNLARNLVAPDGSIGIRITKDSLLQALCKTLGHPLVSTSANMSGRPSPRSFSDIQPEILQMVDYAFEYRRQAEPYEYPAMASSIVRISSNGRQIDFIR